MTARTSVERKHFIVVGRAGMDLYPEPTGTKIAVASQFSAQLGGSAANIAVGLSRLGAGAALLTALSDDPVGRYCRNQLNVHGVDGSLVQTSGPDTRSSLALSESRIEDHETLIYRNGAADFDLAPEHIANVDLSGVSAMVITGTALARAPSRDAVFALIGKAKEAGTDIVLDLDYRPYSWINAAQASETYLAAARQCTIVVGNDLEFAVLWGAKTPTPGHARQLAVEGVGLCIYKMGQAGAITFQGAREIRTGVFPVHALKPVGAGDAFLAAFLAAHYARIPLANCLAQGSAAAALVVTRKGCSQAMPRPEELAEFMNSHSMTQVANEKV